MCVCVRFSSAKPSQDLLGLDIFGNASSSASTPTGGNYTFPSPMAGSNSTTPVTTPSESTDTSSTGADVCVCCTVFLLTRITGD